VLVWGCEALQCSAGAVEEAARPSLAAAVEEAWDGWEGKGRGRERARVAAWREGSASRAWGAASGAGDSVRFLVGRAIGEADAAGIPDVLLPVSEGEGLPLG
jgi:hypothetical protein